MISKINDLWVKQIKSRPEWESYFAFGYQEYDLNLIHGSLDKEIRFRKELLEAIGPFYNQLNSKTYIESQTSDNSTDDRPTLNDSIIAVKLKEAICIAEAEIEIFERELNYFAENNDLNKKKRRGRKFLTPMFFAFEWLVALKINENDQLGRAFVKSFFGPNGDLGNWILEKSKNEDLKYQFADPSSIQDIEAWSTSKQQILERIILSRRLCVEIKSFVGIEHHLATLRDEVSESFEKLKQLTSANEIKTNNDKSLVPLPLLLTFRGRRQFD